MKLRKILFPKVKVYIKGVRIHHSYVGAGLMLFFTQWLTNIYGLVMFGVGVLVVWHDLVCHIVTKAS